MDTKNHPENVRKLYEALDNPKGLLYHIAHAKRPNAAAAYDSDTFRRDFERNAPDLVADFKAAAKAFRPKDHTS